MNKIKNTKNYYKKIEHKIINNENYKINKNINEFNSNPNKIKFLKKIVENCYYHEFCNSFIVFKSIYNILYLIYSNLNDHSIITFNLNDNIKTNTIKGAQTTNIAGFSHYSDKINKRDLIISITASCDNIKLWNFNNLELLYNFKGIFSDFGSTKGYFFNDNNQIYIILNNCYNYTIKIFDLIGNNIKDIEEIANITYYINTYYDNKLLTNFIISCHQKYITSYNYNNNKIYHKYNAKMCSNCIYLSSEINKNIKIIKLIGSSDKGYINIWNFHSGECLDSIFIYNRPIISICLWKNDYIFTGALGIKLLDLKNHKITDIIKYGLSSINIVKKIIHPVYGECLISLEKKNIIKLWKSSN